MCGEALIDLIPDHTDVPPTLSSPWTAMSAGGPMNSAIALARLEHEVEFLGRLGDDSFAAQIRRHLENCGVGVNLAVSAAQPTSLAVVSLDEAGKASYTFHFAGTANFGWRPDEMPALGADDWLHIASLVTVVEPGASVLLDWVRQGVGPLSLDVNIRPTIIADPAEYWAVTEPWLQAVGARGGLVKGSDDDFAFLAGPGGLPADPEALASVMRERYGVRSFVETLGAEGAFASHDDEAVRVPGMPVELVDTIGAGDTFMAGFLSGFVGSGLSLEESAKRGVAASSIVCGRQGANPPTLQEVTSAMA